MTCFCNLHVHTTYSLLDSISKPEDIVKKIKSMGQSGLAVTDHGNVFSSVKMYKLAKEHGLKYIYGCELYICENRFEKDKNNKYFHITVLAKNEKGRLNLNKLVSLGYLEGFYYKPRIDFSLLEQHKEGLIILSGCMASELQRMLANDGGYERAKDIVRKFHAVFGNDYYMEVQSHRDLMQQRLNRHIVDIAKELGIEWVVTADSHFIDEEDKELHSIFVQIGQERETGETYADTQLQSEEEARRMLNSLTPDEKDIAIITTSKILDKCDVRIPLSAPIMPHINVPDGYKDENEYLKHLCRQGWVRREIDQKSREDVRKYKERLLYEYNAICEMGFSGYYLLVHSYVNSVQRRGIARGSAGGSLVAYLLNIVDIDPIKYGLYFERFIDVSALDLLRAGKIKPEELKTPDVDSDFGKTDRDKVIKFIEETYGKDHFASLGSFQYIWDKSAVKDIGRILNIPFDVTNEITRKLGDDTIEEAIQSGLIQEYESKYPKLFDYAKRLTGLPRQFSVHPCGKVVSIDNLTQYTAILTNDGETVLQCDMDDAESLGLVKIDALGLRTVDVIYDVLEMIGKDYEYINPNKLDTSLPDVYEIFQRGYTDGIFQFESDGMKKTLINMIPTSIDDLGVANALYRPGSMKYIDNYINRKHGREEFEFLHADLEQILKTTYGIIVFQEQLIEIGRLAGMRNPDEIRKATAKKVPEKMAKIEPELKSGLKNRGWTQPQVDKLWEDILEFARYSFNKSHSYAYALIAYITAFLKTYHPTEYSCASINSFKGKHDKIGGSFLEAKRLNANILPFDFRNASALCEVKDGGLIVGTSIIKHCNANIADEFLKVKDIEYNSFTELLVDIVEKTSIQSNQIEILTRLGFFNEFGSSEKLVLILRHFNNSESKYKKTYVQKTKDKRIQDILEFEKSIEKTVRYIHEDILFHKEVLGFSNITMENIKDDWYVVVGIDNKYTPKVTLYDLKTSEESTYKIAKKTFNSNDPLRQIQIGSIVRPSGFEQKNKSVPDGNGGFVKLEEKETWITSYSIYTKGA